MTRALRRAMYAQQLSPEMEAEFVAQLATEAPNAGLAFDASLILKDVSLAHIAKGLAESWGRA
jgi:hypothetical protein